MNWREINSDELKHIDIYQELEKLGKLTIPLKYGIWSNESDLKCNLDEIEIYKAFYITDRGHKLLIGTLEQSLRIDRQNFAIFFDIKNLELLRSTKLKRICNGKI